MADENYYDFYFRERDSKKKLRLHNDFHYVDQSFWDASGIKMDNEFLYRVGQIPDTKIDCAVFGTGFYVDPLYYNDPLVDDWANNVFKKYPIPPDNETRYLKLIENGESETIEFKSSFKYDIIEKRANNDLTHLVSIAVCAFLNSRGGTLFIGVEDNKNIIGLDYDLKILKNIDILQQEIPKTIRNDLGGLGILFNLEIEQLKGKLVCIISVRPSEKPIFFNNNEYYVRKGTQNQSLNPKEANDHISVRYKNIIINQEKINRNRENNLIKKFTRLETYFKEKTLHISGELEFQINVIPENLENDLFNESKYAEIKNLLNSISFGPSEIHSIYDSIFNNLKVSREGLQHIFKYSLSSTPMGGNLLLSNQGIILFRCYINDYRPHGTKRRLPTFYISCFILGFFDFLYKFFPYFGYLDDLRIIFHI
ncbi:MAG: helix-turn-helix domain-containing protein, partial [Promethearchaeota archaeon]